MKKINNSALHLLQDILQSKQSACARTQLKFIRQSTVEKWKAPGRARTVGLIITLQLAEDISQTLLKLFVMSTERSSPYVILSHTVCQKSQSNLMRMAPFIELPLEHKQLLKEGKNIN